ncbi:hypothetical protein [Micromonospora violae]|nr:hypothetical protein [Micromonospora violae]
MADRALMLAAAECYLEAAAPADAARCFLAAGEPIRAAVAYVEQAMYREAADAYLSEGQFLWTAWLLAHRVDDIQSARALVEQRGQLDDIRWQLVRARCDAAQDIHAERILLVLGDVQRLQAWPDGAADPIEEWAVAVATALRRPDQAALIFAASARGGSAGAVVRWRDWFKREYGEELVLPPGLGEGNGQ